MAQSTYDAFNTQKVSKFEGSCHYSRNHLFSKVGLDIANPYKYKPVKYLYATSSIKVPEEFLLKPVAKDAWCKESNWIGYVAVATDQGKAALGRRDILIAWRGSIRLSEWIDDFDFPLVSASTILGDSCNANIHRGWLSIYTSDNKHSIFNKSSARDQVLSAVKHLVEKYKEEEISITMTGHSLGAALSILSAADIVANGFNQITGDHNGKHCPVTGFLFGCPRVGDSNFKSILQNMKNLHLLRVNNAIDIIPSTPPTPGYVDIGKALIINTSKSQYLKITETFAASHELEVYLHGVAGTQGSVEWWCMRNKGMAQQDDGSWTLDDTEKDDFLPQKASHSYPVYL